MISRRSFLTWGGLALFAGSGVLGASADPLLNPLLLDCNSQEHSQTLVVIFLRGGLDGMHALVPYREQPYYKLRPNLAIPQSALSLGNLELDDNFALNPALKSLKPHYAAGEMAAICAIGTSDRSRSHFQAQDFLEFGGETVRDGWLNRHLCENGVALSTHPQLPTLLKGQNPVLNATDVQDLMSMVKSSQRVTGSSEIAKASQEEEVFRRRLSKLKPPSDGVYPKTKMGRQLETVAHLLHQGVELQAVHCELGGFDSHSRQVDGLWPGRLLGVNALLHEFSEAVDVFWRDLGELRENVTLLTVTEFGRRLAENGSLGTDHGFASCSFVLGGRVRGGQVYGRWPGLDPEQLIEGIDLDVTTDYRTLINEYTMATGGNRLFPEYRAKQKLGLFSTR